MRVGDKIILNNDIETHVKMIIDEGWISMNKTYEIIDYITEEDDSHNIVDESFYIIDNVGDEICLGRDDIEKNFITETESRKNKMNTIINRVH